MDAIRSQQISEALNYDRNINAMVFNLEKKASWGISRSECDSWLPIRYAIADLCRTANQIFDRLTGQEIR